MHQEIDYRSILSTCIGELYELIQYHTMPDPDSILEPAKTKHGAEIVVPFEELFFTLKNGEAVRNLAHKPCNIMGLRRAISKYPLNSCIALIYKRSRLATLRGRPLHRLTAFTRNAKQSFDVT